jgi:hypothetical protein
VNDELPPSTLEPSVAFPPRSGEAANERFAAAVGYVLIAPP